MWYIIIRPFWYNLFIIRQCDIYIIISSKSCCQGWLPTYPHGKRKLNRQSFKALPLCWTFKFISLVDRQVWYEKCLKCLTIQYLHTVTTSIYWWRYSIPPTALRGYSGTLPLETFYLNFIAICSYIRKSACSVRRVDFGMRV